MLRKKSKNELIVFIMYWLLSLLICIYMCVLRKKILVEKLLRYINLYLLLGYMEPECLDFYI